MPAQTSHQRGLLVGILTGVVATAFEAVAVATVMPAAAEDLGQIGLYAWAFTLFVIGMVFSTVVAGRLVDAMGPARPLAAGMAIFVLGLALGGLAPSMAFLIVARCVQGLGAGAVNLGLMVVVARAFSVEERARVMTAFSFCWVFPAFIGPPIAAWLTAHLSWHFVFWAGIPLMALSVALTAGPLLKIEAIHVVADTSDVRPVPVWTAVAAALGVALLQVFGQWFGESGLTWRTLGAIAVAVALLVAAVPRLMPEGFLRFRAGLSPVIATRALQAGSFFGAEAFLPLALIELRGLSLFQAGLFLTIGSAGWTLGSWLQSRAWLRLRRDRIIQLGLAFTVVGTWTLAVFGWRPATGWWLPAVGWVVGGLGMGLAMASQSLAVMALSPHDQLGRNTSSLQVGEGLGNAAIAGLAGSIFASLQLGHPPSFTFGWVFTAVGVVSTLALMASTRIGPVRNDSSGVG